MKAKSFKKKNEEREIRLAKTANAREAIGDIKHGQDVYVLTFGQFSAIDALVHILDKVGPADVTISTWTAAGSHLERTAELLESAQIKSLKLIVDRSFETRQPEYCFHMRKLFGPDCIRAFRTHAKFMLIRSETHNVVVRTSMNLNENPRLENIEISENLAFAEYFQQVTDAIFQEVDEKENRSRSLELSDLQESFPFMEVEANQIDRQSLAEPHYTHVLNKP